MQSRTMRGFLVLAVAAMLAVGLAGGFVASKENRVTTSENLNSVLWMQTSVEYQMSVTQAYRLAEVMVDRALTDPGWTAIPEQTNARDLRKTAVIFDLDETVLDNLAFQGQLLLDNVPFSPSLWKNWQTTGSPTLLPGAGRFIRRLQELHVDIFYITNRDDAHADETIKLLRGLGLPVDADGANLLSKNKPPTKGSDKRSRREIVAKTHRVLLLLGDDLNDFISGVHGTEATLEGRDRIADAHEGFWGTKWIIIPNPIYGSWERVLYGFDSKLSHQKKLEAKLRHVRGW